MWGCMRAVLRPAVWARGRRSRVGVWRDIRRAARLVRIGPVSRRPMARSIARPTAGGRGTVASLSPLPWNGEDTVSVDLAEIRGVGGGGFEDPKSEEAEHRDQGEVV